MSGVSIGLCVPQYLPDYQIFVVSENGSFINNSNRHTSTGHGIPRLRCSDLSERPGCGRSIIIPVTWGGRISPHHTNDRASCCCHAWFRRKDCQDEANVGRRIPAKFEHPEILQSSGDLSSNLGGKGSSESHVAYFLRRAQGHNDLIGEGFST